MSFSVAAFTIIICCPMVRAAACSVLDWVSALGLVELASTTIMLAVGTIVWSSSSRFETTSTFNVTAPVTLPPGRLRLATRPSSTGSLLVVKTMGIVVVAFIAMTFAGVLVAAKISCQCWQSLVVALCPAVFDRDVAVLDVTGFAQPLAKCQQKEAISLRRC